MFGLLYNLPTATLSGLVALLYLIWLFLSKRSRLPLPPGPRKLPLLGNALDIPSGFEWEAFQRWGKEYNSDIIHLNAAGTSMVVLNSVQAAKDLMEKRSSIYSTRPKLIVGNRLMGFSWLLPFMPYGTAWKERRRLFQHQFHPTNDLLHKPFELKHSQRLLGLLLEDPSNYLTHVQHAVGAFLLTMAYGTEARASSDPAVMLADTVAQLLAHCVTPWTLIFDKLPFLIPVISPFLSGPIFSKTSAYWKDLITRFRDDPFTSVHKNVAEGTAAPSFVTSALGSELLISEEKLDQIKDVAAIIFIGGSSTTNALLHTFFLAILTFPEAQAKAHAELDRVVGRDRLPDFDDHSQLPYLDALLKEIQRWRPAGPLGVPHFLEQDDEYNGYFIPGNSVIIGNAWAMLHNESDYPDASAFKPERFLKDGVLDPSVRDPATVAFGFGRRICPGIHIAQSSLWILAASILSVFEITPPIDENGNALPPSGEYLSGITFQPYPFKCIIKPRHDKVELLISAANDAL